MGNPEVTMMSRTDLEVLVHEVEASEGGCFVCGYELDRLDELGLGVPVIKNLDASILDAVEAGGVLDMGNWHGEEIGSDGLYIPVRQQICGTTHCRAGWAIHLAGEAGIALQEAMGADSAGACIYLASTGSVPDFFASNKEAMEDMRRRAGRAG